MSESEQIAAAAPTDSASPVDEEDRLRPEFVDKVLDAVDEGDDETARRLVQPLHPVPPSYGRCRSGATVAASLNRAPDKL